MWLHPSKISKYSSSVWSTRKGKDQTQRNKELGTQTSRMREPYHMGLILLVKENHSLHSECLRISL